MKQRFEAPQLTVVEFTAEDIVMVSVGLSDGVGGDRETELHNLP